MGTLNWLILLLLWYLLWCFFVRNQELPGDFFDRYFVFCTFVFDMWSVVDSMATKKNWPHRLNGVFFAPAVRISTDAKANVAAAATCSNRQMRLHICNWSPFGLLQFGRFEEINQMKIFLSPRGWDVKGAGAHSQFSSMLPFLVSTSASDGQRQSSVIRSRRVVCFSLQVIHLRNSKSRILPHYTFSLFSFWFKM